LARPRFPEADCITKYALRLCGVPFSFVSALVLGSLVNLLFYCKILVEGLLKNRKDKVFL
uniref:hypothetical protein n=1 Tax=Phascolarctobacterium faecium TaxID=33025 RepID=UPI003AB6777C